MMIRIDNTTFALIRDHRAQEAFDRLRALNPRAHAGQLNSALGSAIMMIHPNQTL
jgi:hypothetical protein